MTSEEKASKRLVYVRVICICCIRECTRIAGKELTRVNDLRRGRRSPSVHSLPDKPWPIEYSRTTPVDSPQFCNLSITSDASRWANANPRAGYRTKMAAVARKCHVVISFVIVQCLVSISWCQFDSGGRYYSRDGLYGPPNPGDRDYRTYTYNNRRYGQNLPGQNGLPGVPAYPGQPGYYPNQDDRNRYSPVSREINNLCNKSPKQQVVCIGSMF